MVRLSYGPQPKKRAKRLFEALLNFANDQFEEGDRLKIQLNTQIERQLIIRTKVRYLEQLTALDSYEGKLNAQQVKEVLKQLKDGLEILEDNRTSTRGSDNWHFTLKLWHQYYEIDANIQQFEEEWERRRPEQSKRVMGEIATPRSKSRSKTPVRPSILPNYPAPSAPYFSITPPVENARRERDNATHRYRERPYHNLPAPDHTILIGREQQTTQLLEWLSFDSPVYRIGIEGIAGAGKTTLMLEVARRCYGASRSDHKIKGVPTFEAIIFTSAKPNRLNAGRILPRLQQERTLRDIFRAIATTLGYPDILTADVNEQLPLIRESLSRQGTLLLLDNLETIEDQQNVLSFLYELPPTVKVIVTTRVQALLDVSVRLDVLPEADGLKLIEHQAQLKQLQLRLSPSESFELYQKTSGLPVAIVYTIGQLSAGYPLQNVLGKLTQATGDIARFCFEESVKLLRGKFSHKLLMALAVFSQSALEEAIAWVAGSEDPVVTTESFAQLQQLSLVKHQQGRSDLLPLTRGYCLAKLKAQPDFEQELRNRWIGWYLKFARESGGKDWKEWNEYDRIRQEWENLTDVIEWCIDRDRYPDVRKFWQSIKCYSHVRGYVKGDRSQNWDTRLDWTDWLIEAAQRHEDWSTAAEVMFDRAWTLTLIGQNQPLEAAAVLFARAWKIREYADPIFQINLAIHICAFRLQQQRLKQATQWLERAKTMFDAESIEEPMATRFSIHLLYYEAGICDRMGWGDRAQNLYEQALEKARCQGWNRAVFLIKNWLADLAIKQRQFDKAREILEEGLRVAERNQDRSRAVFCQRSFAFLEKAKGNFPKARDWAIEAIKGFESLGLTLKAREVQVLLQTLETEGTGEANSKTSV